MIEKAIGKIEKMTVPHLVTICGEDYCDKPLFRIDQDLRAEPIKLQTLSGFVTYIKDVKGETDYTRYIVHVVDNKTVKLISPLDNDAKRETILIATAETPTIPFGQYIDNEKMLIVLQSMFMPDETTDRAKILKFAGTVTNGTIKEYGDDGVKQKATIRSGIASKEEKVIPSPVKLRPFRTFAEVTQPMSEFIFRMKENGDDIMAALFEADGGAWKYDARENIRAYLEANLKDTGMVIIS